MKDLELYREWKQLINLPSADLRRFLESDLGKEAGLSRAEASEKGIRSGRDSGRAILRMRDKGPENWNDNDWDWARRQVAFVKRMRGVDGALMKDGAPTRKYLALLVWGHDPKLERNAGMPVLPHTSDWFSAHYRAWYLDGEWISLPHGATHADWARQVFRDYESTDAQVEARMMKEGGIKQNGSNFHSREFNDRVLSIIQDRVMDMVNAHPGGISNTFRIHWGRADFVQVRADDLVGARHAEDLRLRYAPNISRNERASANRMQDLRVMAANGSKQKERLMTEKLIGGRADGMLPRDFQPRELIRGTLHEMEHTDDPPTAMEIAMDHLVEHPDYYEVLEAAEATMSTSPRLTPNVAGAVASEAAILAREAPAVAAIARGAAPEIAATARVVVPRSAGWISRAVRWFREGYKESAVVKKLVASGIPKRAAAAIADAAEAFLASELQIAASKAAGRVRDRRARSPQMAQNAGYYVWVVNRDFEPISEDVQGPYNLLSAKTYARIAATKGRHNRSVSRGLNPEAASFEVVRTYAAGTGERLG